MSKLYFEASKTAVNEECTPKLLNELGSIRARLAESERKSSQLEADFQALRESNDALTIAYEDTRNKMHALVEAGKAKNKQLKFYQSCEKEWLARDKEHKALKNTVQKYSYIENLVKVSESDSKLLLEKAAKGPGALDRLISMCVIIKREYEQCKRNKKAQRNELDKVLKELASFRVELEKVEFNNVVLREQNERAEKELTENERQILELKKKLHSVVQDSSPTGLTSPNKNGDKLQKADLISVDGSSPGELGTTPGNGDRPIRRVLVKSPLDGINSQRSAPTNDGRIHQISIKITTAATSSKLSRKFSSAGSSELFSDAKFSALTPTDKPVIQNSRKGYDGLGGHTMFTQCLFRPNYTPSSRKRPLRYNDHAVSIQKN